MLFVVDAFCGWQWARTTLGGNKCKIGIIPILWRRVVDFCCCCVLLKRRMFSITLF
jgi:hypothetical protein